MNKISYHTVYRLSWLLCIVTLPMSTKVTSFFCLVLIAVWLADVGFLQKWERLRKTTWILPLFLFFVLHLIGVAYSENTSDGWFEVEKKLSFLFIPLILASGRPLTKADFNFLKNGFVVACLIAVVCCLVFTLFSVITDKLPLVANFDPDTYRNYKAFNPDRSPLWEYFSYIQIASWIELHPAYFSMYLIFSITILVQRRMDCNRFNRISLIVILLFAIFITLLSSRMAILSFIMLAVIVTVIAIRKEHYQVAILPMITVGVLCLFIVINPVSNFRFFQEPSHTDLDLHPSGPFNSVSYRLVEWQASTAQLKKTWMNGVGSGDGQSALQAGYQQYGNDVVALNYNAHNQYLQTMLELGVTGLLLLLACIYGPLLKKYLLMEHVAFILLFGSMCLTESMLSAQKGIVFFVLFQSLYLHTHKS